MAHPGILVDLDGTLVDSNYLHTVAWARGFVDAGYPEVAMADIHRSVGMGSDVLPGHILGHDAPEVAEARKGHWQRLRPEVRALPGAAALLGALHARGLAVVLATSADEEDLEVLLPVLGADPPCIDHVTTAGDVEASKPHPDVFQVAMEAAGLDPARTVALGDTVWDVEAATRAGVACVAVETGGIGRADLLAAGAAAVYRDAAELHARLDASPIGLLLASP